MSIIYSESFLFHVLAVCGLGLMAGSFVLLRTQRDELS
jgi:hypothetical protein